MSATFQNIAKKYPTISILPQQIHSSIKKILQNIPHSDIQKHSQNLINYFKEDTLIKAKYIIPTTLRKNISFKRVLNPDLFPRNPPSYSEGESLAYLAWQFPLSYAIIERCLNEIRRRDPSFNPVNMLDWGSGPAVGSSSAIEVWNSSLKKVVLVDYSESMLQISQKFLSITYPSINVTLMKEMEAKNMYDLVIASQSLNELSNDKERIEMVKSLFMKCKSYLLLIERGTPEGSRIIQGIRDSFINNEMGDFHIFAPCSHESECPFIKNGGGDWCHFKQRSELSSLQMSVNIIKKGFNDPSFTYLIIKKGKRDEGKEDMEGGSGSGSGGGGIRIIKDPIKRKGHIVQHYCSPSNISKGVVARSDGKDIYQDGRKSSRGDLWPHPLKRLERKNLLFQDVEE